MITIGLQGGLGNQMFQYALGVALRARGKKVNFDLGRLSIEDTESPHTRKRAQYGLNGYDTDVTFGESFEPRYVQSGVGYDPKVFEMDNVTLWGYWQSEKYFQDLGEGLPLGHPIIHRFFPIKGLTSEIKEVAKCLSEDDTVAVQVRRGDYLAVADFHGLMSREYFLQGIEATGRKKVYVFTDDEQWCRQNLPGTIVSTGTRHWDITLMSCCNSLVTSNSSFGWWGGWLGDNNFKKPGRVVVAPKKWFATPSVDDSGLVPERWVRI